MADYFRLRVQLCDVKPAIWRRFQLTTRTSFMDLHRSIQAACGWEDAHLFDFEDARGRVIAGVPDRGGRGPGDPDATSVKLASHFAKPKDRCFYVYDFGDRWVHDVTLEAIDAEPKAFSRRLLDGERAFPAEDCGGVHGYHDCVEAVRTRSAPEDVLESLEGWDPERFDLTAAQRAFDC